MEKEITKLQFGSPDVFIIKDATARKEIEDIKNDLSYTSKLQEDTNKKLTDSITLLSKQINTANKELEEILGV